MVAEIPLAGVVIRNTVTSPVEGLIDYFYENDSYLYTKNDKGEIIIVSMANAKKNYVVNGIMTDKETVIANYLLQEGRDDLVVRHNPTSGFLGDLIESGLGKTLGEVAPETGAMARYVATDYYHRGGIEDASNTAHSQGTIITANAAKLYDKTYGVGFDLSGDRLPRWYNPQINQTQTVNAVGPAVSNRLWGKVIKSFGNDVEENSSFEHQEHDSVRRLTAPSNPFDFARGLIDLINIQDHDVKNYKYSYYVTDKSYIGEHNFPKPINVKENYPDPRETLKHMQNGDANVFNPYGVKP